MNIELNLVDEGGGKITAHATVVKDDDMPQKGVSVTFKLGGKATGASVRVDDDGLASKELKAKIGVATQVTASVVGKPHVAASEIITLDAAKRRSATPTELIISCLFLAVVATASYMTSHLSVLLIGLVGTLAILFIGSSDGKDFVKRLQNNDWIFYTMRGITIFAFLMFLIGLWVDPPELNPVKALGNQLKDMVSTELEDPWANERWFNFTGFFTGWWKTALFFLFWTALAYPVSFWDEMKNHKKEIAIVAGILWVANTLSKRKK